MKTLAGVWIGSTLISAIAGAISLVGKLAGAFRAAAVAAASIPTRLPGGGLIAAGGGVLGAVGAGIGAGVGIGSLINAATGASPETGLFDPGSGGLGSALQGRERITAEQRAQIVAERAAKVAAKAATGAVSPAALLGAAGGEAEGAGRTRRGKGSKVRIREAIIERAEFPNADSFGRLAAPFIQQARIEGRSQATGAAALGLGVVR